LDEDIGMAVSRTSAENPFRQPIIYERLGGKTRAAHLLGYYRANLYYHPAKLSVAKDIQGTNPHNILCITINKKYAHLV
jgi:hypothetical protein